MGITYVDFLIPDEKIVIEIQGPQHYIKKPLERMSEWNLITDFKV